MGTRIAEIRVNERIVYAAVLAAGIPARILLTLPAEAPRDGRHDSGLPDLLVVMAFIVPLGAVHPGLTAKHAGVIRRFSLDYSEGIVRLMEKPAAHRPRSTMKEGTWIDSIQGTNGHAELCDGLALR